MAIKNVLVVFIVTLVIYQVNCANIIKRDTKDATNTIDNFLNELKTNFNDLMAKVQNNEDLQKISNQVKALGQEFSDKATKFTQDTQKAFKTD